MDTLIRADDRVFVGGNRGMAGSNFCRGLLPASHTNLLTTIPTELDLENAPYLRK
jgi:hypothetical protein